MTRRDRLEEMRRTLSELAQAHVTAALCVSQLQDLTATDADVIAPAKHPRADENKFCVVWGRRTCHLGHTRSFHLFARLLRRTNHYVSHDHLLRDVWRGDQRSADTVRSAICLLKKKLKRAHMHRLADAIQGQGRHYGLILSSPRHH